MSQRTPIISRRSFLKTLGAAAGLSLLPNAFTAQSHSRPDAPRHVVLTIVDALRADHTTPYGYSRDTTPTLASLASAGATFAQACSTSPWTSPANAAIVTGRQPQHLGITWEQTVLPAAVLTLAEHLKSAGYYTAGFNASAWLNADKGFARGFDVYREIPTSVETSGCAGSINAEVLDWLANDWPAVPDGTPLFLFLYYIDPHSWYIPPDNLATDYRNLYTDPGYTGPFSTPMDFKNGEKVVDGTIAPTAADTAQILAWYDGETRYWDDSFAAVVQALNTAGVGGDALFVVTADHGDMFGEHAKWNHSNSLYQELLHVPLILRGPTISSNTVIDTPVQTLDLFPTLLEYAGIALPSPIDGQSLWPLLQGQNQPHHDLFAELDQAVAWIAWIAPDHDLRSVQRGSWKYIHHVGHPELDELYQLNPTSVYETTNQIQSQPTLAAELQAALLAHFGLYRVDLPLVLR